MATLSRKAQKIFGGSLAAPSNIAVYGSLKAGSPSYSLDPDAIQTPAWLQAFNDALINAPGGNASPAKQDLAAVLYVITRQLAYLLQDGIPEWDATTVYALNSYCKVGGVQYISKTADNVGHDPTTDTNNWKTLASTLLGTQDGVSKAWVTFNGVTGAIYSAFNVSSVNRTAAGAWLVNFQTALPNANYAMVGSCGTPDGSVPIAGDNNHISGGTAGQTPTRTTTQCSVYSIQGSTGALEDSQLVSVCFFCTTP